MAITIQDVRDILPPAASAQISDDAIQAAIDASQCLLDQFSASFCGASFSASCLDQIHKYLAAHFLSATEPTISIAQESSDECCRSSVRYSWDFSDGLRATPYGQLAISLSGGCLAEYDKQPANIFSIGAHGGQAEDYFI